MREPQSTRRPGGSIIPRSGEAQERVAPSPDLPDSLMDLEVTAEQSGGGLTVLEHVMPLEDTRPPLHAHQAADEAFYVLHGRLRVRLDHDESEVSTGDVVWIPRWTPHTFAVRDGPVRYLAIVTPG